MKSHIETTVIPSLLSRLTTNSQRKHKNAAKSSALCNPSLFHSMLCKEGTFFSEWNGELRPESVGSVQIVCTNSTDLKNFLCLRTLLPLPTQCSWWAPRCAAVTQTARGGLSVFLKDTLTGTFIYESQCKSHTTHCAMAFGGETAALIPADQPEALQNRWWRMGLLQLVPAGIPVSRAVMQAPELLHRMQQAPRPQGLYSLQWGIALHITPHQTRPSELTHFPTPVSVKPTPPHNLFQILQIKLLCLQCLSSFLQYIHISELPLNTITVHLASNYSNRKTGNHCHSDCGISMLHGDTLIHLMECLLH